MWRAAADFGVSWNVPVRHLLEVDTVRPANGKDVYLLENSGVFSTFLDARPDMALVCTNGQFRLAIWLLLEKMAKAGCRLLTQGISILRDCRWPIKCCNGSAARSGCGGWIRATIGPRRPPFRSAGSAF
ncbi:DUF2399 domain-containing protein [Terrilactibacillus sp. S3-3]|nr:DUF2399 domain-containing protein [Terrilactibacillus sp. S3-3]